MKLITIPILNDNYVWLLNDKQHTLIIDPGVAQPIIDYLKQHNQQPTAILLTHHHDDHTAGVADLVKHYPNLNVYGPQECLTKGANEIVQEGDTLQFGSLLFSVIDVPGHTLQHIAYYCAPYLFCGDTLFSAGCGRIFEGTYEQMFSSLTKLAQLPDDTIVCSAHEYTLSNLEFELSLVPDDVAIQHAYQKAKQLRADNKPTLPSTLRDEKKINLFLRCNEPQLQTRFLPDTHQTTNLDLFRFFRTKKNQY